MKLIIVNGPNLNLLGIRETSIYGNSSFDSCFKDLQAQYKSVSLEYYQSNVEGELINRLQSSAHDGIILNAGGYSHTSVAISDAIAAIKVPVVEVHISNIYAREAYRHVSLLSRNCAGVITGFGLNSYRLAIQYFLLQITPTPDN